MEKMCYSCNNNIPLSEFYKNKSSKDGLQHKCKKCVKQYAIENKERISKFQSCYREQNKTKTKEYNVKYREENKEKLKEQKKRYYTENHECFKVKRQEYYLKNKDVINVKGKEFYNSNKEKIMPRLKLSNQKWRAKNKEKVRYYCQRRRAKINSLVNDLTLGEWEYNKSLFNDCCSYCGCSGKMEQEHIIPVSKGGGYTSYNIIPACRSCNSSKGNKDFSAWYPSSEFYSKDRELKILNFISVEGGENNTNGTEN